MPLLVIWIRQHDDTPKAELDRRKQYYEETIFGRPDRFAGYPEALRQLAANGAEVLLRVSAYMDPWGATPPMDWWTVVNRCRALENTAYVVAANQGASLRHYPPYSWPGGSQVVDFDARAVWSGVSLIEMWAWQEADFLRHTEGSAIRRIGFERWQRNLAVALGNALRGWRSAQDPATQARRAEMVSALRARAREPEVQVPLPALPLLHELLGL